MADFDPDAYLASKEAPTTSPSGSFDPDAYLSSKGSSFIKEDATKYFNNGTFDVNAWAKDHPEIGPGLTESAARGAAQGLSAGTQPSLSPLLERAYAQLFGDDATKELYNNTSNEALKKTYVDQNQAALQAHPSAYILGQVGGSLPSAIAAGGVANAAASGLGSAVGLGSLAPVAATEGATAIPAATGLAKAGLVGLHAGGQVLTQGTLGGIQGYNADPMASDADKQANAIKGAETAAALAGPLAAAAPYAPAAARTIGGALLGGAAANVTNPLHPTLGKTLLGAGLGAGVALAAPGALDKLGIANDLEDSYNFGKQGTKLVNKGDVNRVQGEVGDLANQVSNSLGDLDKQITAPAIQTIQDTYQGALEGLTKDLNATPEQAQQIIQQGHANASDKLNSLMTAAEKDGKTVSVKNALEALTEQLKQDISSSGNVVGDVDRKTVQNAIDNMNGYLTKTGVPIDIKSNTIVGADGKPFMSSISVGGKNLTSEQVQSIVNPETRQIEPEALQQMTGSNGEINPVSANIKTTNMGSAFDENGNPIKPSMIELNQRQQFIPQEEQSGEMSIPEAQNVKRMLGKMGYDSSSIPPEVKGRFIQANQDLNDIISGAFEKPATPFSEGSNEYTEANAKLSAIHDLGKLVGTPTKLYSIGEQIPPAELQNIVKGVGTSLTDADNTKFQQVVKLLNVIDPEGAQKFQSNVQQISNNLAQLKSAGSTPLEQFGGLAEQGLATPESIEAAQNITQVNTIKNTAGGPSTDVDVNGNQLPSDQSYKFVKNLGQTGPADQVRSEIDPALKAKMDNTMELLNKYNPDLVEQLSTQGKSVARQSELLENNAVNPKSLIGRTGYFVKQGLVRGANLAGQASSSPIVNPFFNALGAMVNTGAPLIAPYMPALAAAYKRGNSALTATNYSLMQSDPEYRQIVDQFNQRFQ